MDETSVRWAGRRPMKGFSHWFLVGGDRLLVSLVMLLAIGAAFVAVAATGIATVTTPGRVMWFLNGTVNGLLTLVPITVGVNQIVLSHEFGSIQDLYDRRQAITEFRERVEAHTGTAVSSPHASAFIGTLLTAVADVADTIERRTDELDNEQRRDELASLAGTIREEADRVSGDLATDEGGMLRTLLVALDHDDTRQFHEIRRHRAELADGDEAMADELERLSDLFVEIDATRQFLKTIVVERQLARLSRLLVYSSIPAVTIAAVGIFSYRNVAGLTLSRPGLVMVAAALIVSTLVPLAILGAYVLRVATIALQTASYGPFVPESDE